VPNGSKNILIWLNIYSNMTSIKKLQDEIKTEKFELNKFHASEKDPFY
jgi:hypothetical protein